jgi:hypothetical protein
MTSAIHSADWPTNMSADDRKVWMHEQITKWVGEKKIEECLSALELGNLSMTEKAVAYRSILIIGGIRHCRAHARAEARMPILTLITYLSDNAKGVCVLSITKMQELLNRSRPCIIENILALETEGLIGVARVDGMPNSYWPRIPAALAEMSPNPVWVVEAVLGQPKQKIYRTAEAAIAAATEDQATAVNQSAGVNQYQATAVNQTSKLQPGDQLTPAAPLVNSSTHSISSLNLFSSSHGACGGEAADTTKKGRSSPTAFEKGSGSGMPAVLTSNAAGRKGLAISPPTASIGDKSAMAAALGGQAAYANRNIIIADSGKISIGEKFRAELRETYTDSQIERGIERAPSQTGGSTDPIKLLSQIRRCCSYAKQDDAATDKKLAAMPKGQSARKTYER